VLTLHKPICIGMRLEGVDANEYNKHAEILLREVHKLQMKESLSDRYVWRIATINAQRRLEGVDTTAAKQFLFDLSLLKEYQDFGEVLGFIR